MNRDLYIGNGVEQSGPYTEAEIRMFVASGQVTAQSQCWREGMGSWMPAWQMFPEFFQPLQAPSTPAPVQPPFHQPSAGPVPPAAPQPYTLPPPKKRSCCCSGCLILILVILLGIGGLAGYAWFRYRQPSSPVDKEYKTIPDYFPPESAIRLISRAGQL